MGFVEGGVVPKIYEYTRTGKRYPVWEKAGNPSNVWLITREKLDENVHHSHSYPDLRAEGNGYYIYGFTYDPEKVGQARGEFFRYLAWRRCTPADWNVLPAPRSSGAGSVQTAAAENSSRAVKPPTCQAKAGTEEAAKKQKRKTASRSQPGAHADIIKAVELKYARAIAEKFGVSKPENGDVNAAVKKWENEDPELFRSLFHSADDLEMIDRFNGVCPDLAYVTQKFALFELVIGNVQNAKMIILNNNPGADSLTQTENELEQRIANFVGFLGIFVTSQQNGGPQNLKNVYYPFTRQFITSIGDYFPKRFLSASRGASPKLFDCLLQGRFRTNRERKSMRDSRYQYPDRYFDIWEKAAPHIVSLERFGYHSEYFKKYEDRLQGEAGSIRQREKVAGILRKASEKDLAARPIILVFRGSDDWTKLLGENFFSKYRKVYYVSNPRNPCASEAQIGSERFEQLKEDWNALIADRDLRLT